MTMAKDGSLIATGGTYSSDGDFNDLNKGQDDITFLKFDDIGNIIVKKTFGGNNADIGTSITNGVADEYIIAGNTFSNDGDFPAMNNGHADMFIAKIDANGTLLWNKGFGGSALDYGNHVTVTQNNDYIISGSTKSAENIGAFRGKEDIILLKISNNGEVLCSKGYGGSEIDRAVTVLAVDQSQLMVYGYSASNDADFESQNKGLLDVFLMKLDSNGILTNPSAINQFNEYALNLQVHPNPCSDMSIISFTVETPSRIKVELLNSLGQTLEVMSDDFFERGTYQSSLNTSNIPSGIYSVRMQSGSHTVCIPIVNVK